MGPLWRLAPHLAVWLAALALAAGCGSGTTPPATTAAARAAAAEARQSRRRAAAHDGERRAGP